MGSSVLGKLEGSDRSVSLRQMHQAYSELHDRYVKAIVQSAAEAQDTREESYRRIQVLDSIVNELVRLCLNK